MKNKLQQKLYQKSVITHDLQQAILLMQLSSDDLDEKIKTELTENPLLKLTVESKNNDTSINILSDRYAQSWHQTSKYTPSFQVDIEDVSQHNLHAYLMSQINFFTLTDLETAIAWYIIDSINDDGFFIGNFNEIKKSLNIKLKKQQFERVRKIIHELDPNGIGCQDLTEFLLYQLHKKQKITCSTVYNLAEKLIKNDLISLNLVQDHIMIKKYHTDKKTLYKAIALIKKLQMRPNPFSDSNSTHYIKPDVYMTKIDGQWHIKLNSNHLVLTLDKNNLQLLNHARAKKEVREYLKANLYSAKWLIKCLAHRDKVLLEVSQAIFTYQRDFLTKGNIAIKPLTQLQIAKMLNLHESSISRIIANKYIATPFGIFPFKHFFASHLKQVNNTHISNKIVSGLIKNMIAHESSEKKFSDQQLTDLLKKEYGIQIARRTVSKYRQSLGILSTKYRRKLNH